MHSQAARLHHHDNLNDLGQKESQPTADVSCRLGYTADHAIFALLYVVLFCWAVHFRQRLPQFPRRLSCTLLAINVPIHALLGGVCHSSAISTAVHTRKLTFPVLWISGSLFVLNGMNVLMLLCVGLVIFGKCFLWRLAIPIGANLLLLMGIAALNLVYPADLDGSLMHRPEADWNDQNLHWAVWLRAFILQLFILNSYTATQMSYLKCSMDDALTVGTSQPGRHVSRISSFDAGLSTSNPLSSQWLWLAALVSVTAILIAIIGQENIGSMFLCGTLAAACYLGGITAFGMAAFGQHRLWSRHLLGIGVLGTTLGSVLQLMPHLQTDWFLIRVFFVSLHSGRERMRELLAVGTVQEETIWWFAVFAGYTALAITMLPYYRRVLGNARDEAYRQNTARDVGPMPSIREGFYHADPTLLPAGFQDLGSCVAFDTDTCITRSLFGSTSAQSSSPGSAPVSDHELMGWCLGSESMQATQAAMVMVLAGHKQGTRPPPIIGRVPISGTAREVGLQYANTGLNAGQGSLRAQAPCEWASMEPLVSLSGSGSHPRTIQELEEAQNRGLLSVPELTEAKRRALKQRIRSRIAGKADPYPRVAHYIGGSAMPKVLRCHNFVSPPAARCHAHACRSPQSHGAGE